MCVCVRSACISWSTLCETCNGHVPARNTLQVEHPRCYCPATFRDWIAVPVRRRAVAHKVHFAIFELFFVDRFRDCTARARLSSVTSLHQSIRRFESICYMRKRQSLHLLLQLALTVQTLANFTSNNDDHTKSLRIAFAPHPFLSHWAVSAPIAHELLLRGHKALVSSASHDWFRSS